MAGSSARTRCRSSGRPCRSPTRWTTPATSSSASCRARWETDKEWGFVVEAEGRYAGHIALRNEGDRRAEIAYGSHPWVRGTGHMERALRMLLDWGFREKDLATVIWLANVGNWASRRVAWRLGFTFEGTPAPVAARTAASCATPGRARCSPTTRASRSVAGSTTRCSRATAYGCAPFREATPGRVVEACRDERTRTWLGDLPSPYGPRRRPRSSAAEPASCVASGNGLSWAVADPQTDRLLGSVGIFDLTDDLAFGEVGYWAHPDARGRGVMTEAVGLVLRHAFETLGLHRVKAYAARGNAASQHVLMSNGMSEQGVERLGTVVAEGRVDAVLYDVLRGEWARRTG